MGASEGEVRAEGEGGRVGLASVLPVPVTEGSGEKEALGVEEVEAEERALALAVPRLNEGVAALIDCEPRADAVGATERVAQPEALGGGLGVATREAVLAPVVEGVAVPPAASVAEKLGVPEAAMWEGLEAGVPETAPLPEAGEAEGLGEAAGESEALGHCEGARETLGESEALVDTLGLALRDDVELRDCETVTLGAPEAVPCAATPLRIPEEAVAASGWDGESEVLLLLDLQAEGETVAAVQEEALGVEEVLRVDEGEEVEEGVMLELSEMLSWALGEIKEEGEAKVAEGGTVPVVSSARLPEGLTEVLGEKRPLLLPPAPTAAAEGEVLGEEEVEKSPLLLAALLRLRIGVTVETLLDGDALGQAEMLSAPGGEGVTVVL